jgi:hypothetical protein
MTSSSTLGKRLLLYTSNLLLKGAKKLLLSSVNKLKDMIRQKGDFYLPKSRSHSRDASPNMQFKMGSPDVVKPSESKNDHKSKEYSSNEIVIRESVEGGTEIAA